VHAAALEAVAALVVAPVDAEHPGVVVALAAAVVEVDSLAEVVPVASLAEAAEASLAVEDVEVPADSRVEVAAVSLAAEDVEVTRRCFPRLRPLVLTAARRRSKQSAGYLGEGFLPIPSSLFGVNGYGRGVSLYKFLWSFSWMAIWTVIICSK